MADTTLARLHSAARRTLAAAGLAEAALDARILVEALTGTSRTDAVADPERAVPAVAAEAVAIAIRRRLAGEPVFRIIGRRAFHGLKLAVTRETLEPRPDTETLVDLALPHLRQAAAARGAVKILDLGTGTGAIALALISEVPAAFATATDILQGALDTAVANAVRHGLAARFSTLRSNWFEAVRGQFDLIVSNPPYIETAAIAGLDPEVRDHDPHAALDGGEDGLDAYRAIAKGAAFHLVPTGAVALEIGHLQKAAVVAIFAGCGYSLAGAACDLGGRDRALIFVPNPSDRQVRTD